MKNHEPGQPKARTALITGEIGSGKTTVAGRVAERARHQGLTNGGLWCPARMTDGSKTGILAADLSGGERRLLAVRVDAREEATGFSGKPGPATGQYAFDPATLTWANRVLSRAVAARPDLLVVDEIGPLELEQDQGLVPVLETLSAGIVPAAMVVVRRRLLENLRERLGASRTASFIADRESRETLPDRILAWLFPGPDQS
jgi:nucleoside-triphosphatase THEP1